MPPTAHETGNVSNVLGTDSQRVLAVGGLLLAAAGMLFGEWFAIFVLHPNNARIGEAMFAAAQMIPQGDADGIMAQFGAIGGFLENRGTKVDTHSHMIHMGYIALLLAVVQPWVELSEETKRITAWLYVISAALMPISIFSIHYVGLAYSPLSFIGWASIFADLFGGLLALSMFIQLWGLWCYRQGDTPAMPALPDGGKATKVMLAGGALLLVWGFLYGAFYAGWLQYGSWAPEVDILRSILSSAAASDSAGLGQAFDAYGRYLMLTAINVATHTHINEVGILLLLLAFVQGIVAFEEARRVFWARMAVGGAFFMPIGILLEIPYGFVGSVIVDAAGFVLIISLLAMLSGMLKYWRGERPAAGGES